VDILIISGLSGSGKSVALRVLEDAGFYCIDNLPGTFVLEVVEFLADAHHGKVGLSIDIRSPEAVEKLPNIIEALKQRNMQVQVMFLDSSTQSLVKRFSETRRPHPLMKAGRTLEECIVLERSMLADIAELGHRIDTSDLGTNTLRGWVREFIHLDDRKLTLFFVSFGFKNGIPQDADLVFDVRPLPNPYYDPAMRGLTGLDAAVIAFIESLPAARKMLEDISRFLDYWLPAFVRDNRRTLTVAIGCTGGQHRSVYFAEKLAEHFRAQQQVQVRHRGLYRGDAKPAQAG
jgi:RNase adapter protein RapZ